MNRICSIYGHGAGADTSKTFNYVTGDLIEGTTTGTLTGSGARSINVDDVNKICGVTPSTELDSNYGKSSYTKSIFYPTTGKSTGYSTSATRRTDVSTCYQYWSKYLTDKTTEVYKMLFRDTANSKNIHYLLASRCVNSQPNFSSFKVHNVSQGGIGYSSLFSGYSSNFEKFDANGGVRPIVYLKSNIQTSGQDSSGVWNIISEHK